MRRAALLACLALPQGSWTFGRVVAVVDDLDGDGISELAIGEPHGEIEGPGRVWLLSPTSERVFWRWEGDDGLGGEVLTVGDVDGDGGSDLLIGSGADEPVDGEFLIVLSGRNGEPLAYFPRPYRDHSLGPTLAACPDIDGDRSRDCITIARDGVWAFSTSTGEMLWHRALDMDVDTVVGFEDQDREEESRVLVWSDSCRLLRARDGGDTGVLWPRDIGWFDTACGIPDRDGDGLGELVLAVQQPFSRLILLSGCTLETLGSFSTGLDPEEYLVLSYASDLGVDRRRQIVLGAHGSNVALGSIHVFDLSDGRCSFRSEPARNGGDRHHLGDHYHFGAATTPLGDIDSDGVIDLAVGEDHRWSRTAGIVDIVSGRDGRILREIQRPDLHE